jgi:hypothetical protein
MVVKRQMTAASAAIALLVIGAAAQAKVYDFTFVGQTYTISDGVFVTSNAANADGTHDIISATGTLVSSDLALPQGAFTMTPGNGANLTSSDGTEDYSNLYTPRAKSFADQGLQLQGQGLEINIYNAVNANFSGCGATDCLSAPNSPLYNPGDLGVVSITTVPEPASWAVMLIGLGAVGGAMRVSRRQRAIAA